RGQAGPRDVRALLPEPADRAGSPRARRAEAADQGARDLPRRRHLMTAVHEFRELSDDELVTRLGETKAEAFNLRFQHVTGQLDNTSRLGQLRRDVARINTLLR